MYRLIVADIDGTLVNNSDAMSKECTDYLNKLHENGYLFAIASGRYVIDILRNIKGWKLNFVPELLIALNGAMYFDNIANKSFTLSKLKREWVKEILNIMDVFKLNPYVVNNGIMLCHHIDDYVIRSSKRNDRQLKIAKSYEDYYDEQYKVLFEIKASDYEKIDEYLSKFNFKDYKYVKTQDTMVEFVRKDTDKSIALCQFCNMHDIDMKEVVAFGDGQNDIGIIESAGLGVALKNGDRDLLKVADIVTKYSNDEDGFLKTLKEIICI